MDIEGENTILGRLKMIEQDDWRLGPQMDYLFRAHLQKKRFQATPRNDHEHCEFCWAKFSEYPDDLHEGYFTIAGVNFLQARWICETCFDDFKEMFEWTVE